MADTAFFLKEGGGGGGCYCEIFKLKVFGVNFICRHFNFRQNPPLN